jgi:hypothetical protein
MKTILFALTVCLSFSIHAQYSYEPSEDFPFGRPHPDSPSQILDYAPLIGECDCQSTKRNPDGSWAVKEQMTWRFKYIMNGTAIQDETLKENGGHSGSIRQFIADSSKWYVHYYSNSGPSTILATWEGQKQGDSIVLYRDQKVPANFWETTKDKMIAQFGQGHFKAGLVEGVHCAGEKLAQYFPWKHGDTNELSDEISTS